AAQLDARVDERARAARVDRRELALLRVEHGDERFEEARRAALVQRAQGRLHREPGVAPLAEALRRRERELSERPGERLRGVRARLLDDPEEVDRRALLVERHPDHGLARVLADR